MNFEEENVFSKIESFFNELKNIYNQKLFRLSLEEVNKKSIKNCENIGIFLEFLKDLKNNDIDDNFSLESKSNENKFICNYFTDADNKLKNIIYDYRCPFGSDNIPQNHEIFKNITSYFCNQYYFKKKCFYIPEIIQQENGLFTIKP